MARLFSAYCPGCRKMTEHVVNGDADDHCRACGKTIWDVYREKPAEVVRAQEAEYWQRVFLGRAKKS